MPASFGFWERGYHLFFPVPHPPCFCWNYITFFFPLRSHRFSTLGPRDSSKCGLTLLWTHKQGCSVQLLSCVWLFASPWTEHTRLPYPSSTPGACLLKLMSIKLVMPSNHLILCHPLLLPPSIFPSIRVFSIESVLWMRWPIIRVSVSASVLPMNIKDWSPLGLTGWISLQSKGLSRVFSNTTVQKHLFFGTQLSLSSSSHIHTWLLEKP